MKIDRERLYKILETRTSKFSNTAAFFLIFLIIANILLVIYGTLPIIGERYMTFLYWFEFVSVIFFSAEYLLRVWVCVENDRFKHPILGRLRYAFSPMALIDLLAFLPFYLPLLFAMDLRFLRAARLFRLLRLLKVERYSRSLNTIGRVIKREKGELLITLFTILIFLVLCSSLVYLAERDTQPEMFSSIPAAMWWGVATLTTVGYGDIYPVTAVGKILGAFTAFLGIVLIALPAGILGAGFMEETRKRQRPAAGCSHCGKENAA